MDVPRLARRAVVALAALGILACLAVVLLLWPSWSGNPGWRAAIDLAILLAATPLCLWLALLGPRALGVPAALALLAWGWLGTWLYGFLWVPGLAALLGCLVPRGPRRPSAVAARAC